MSTWHVILLGLIEGLTEFLPVSSTGHLLLAGHFLGFKSPGKTFEVLIQLGAILAILSVYFGKLMRLLFDLPSDARTRRFVLGVLVAFLPAAVVGATLHKYIKGVLFEEPWLVCTTLIVGGIVLLAVDRMQLQPRYHDVMDYPVSTAFLIGLANAWRWCRASPAPAQRSSARCCSDRTSAPATEFTFFLAMPTMAGAFAYDLYKNWANLAPEDIKGIALGFVVSFIAGVIVVRYLLGFVSRHGFAPFAWWRIIVGGVSLGALAVLG